MNQNLPPKLLLNLFRLYCRPGLHKYLEGDLIELYQERIKEKSKLNSNTFFLLEVLKLFRPGIVRSFSNSKSIKPFTMFNHHFKTAIRHSIKYKSYTAINLLGLVVGIASSMLILLWVQDELSVNQFHNDADRIYKVWRNMHQGNGEVVTTPGIPQPLEIVLREEYPEIEKVSLVGWVNEPLMRVGEKISYEMGRYVSPDFFEIFTYKIIRGDQKTPLNDISSIAISERLASKLFGPEWDEKEILGESIRVNNLKNFTISAIFETPPTNTSIDMDWAINARDFMNRNSWVESWYNGGFRLYIKLRENADLNALREKVKEEINENTNYEADEKIYLQAHSEEYLNSIFANGIPTGGRIQYVIILSIVAVFLLVIACINFVNLATARAAKRAKEIGVKKVLGSSKGILRQQFFTESFLLTITASALAVGLAAIFIPSLNFVTGKSLSIDLSDPLVWISLIGITLITTLLAGVYPALLLPSLKTLDSLRDNIKLSFKGVLARKGLVVFQFTLSILLIIGTIVASQQLDYILTKNLGLDRDNVVFMELEGDWSEKTELIRNELLQIPEVSSISFSSGNPLNYGWSTGGASWDGKNTEDEVEINVLNVDDQFIPAMGIEVVQGRNFSKDITTDTVNFLINQTAAEIIGYENPIGGNLHCWGRDGKIVGVIKDFHMDNMYEQINPLIVRYDPSGTNTMFARVHSDIPKALNSLESAMAKISPDFPFRFAFMDDEYEQVYQNEITVSTLMKVFAVISIFISCLGLLGLSSFTADQKAKEIGVRKVHGAGIQQLVLMLSKSYAVLMTISFIIAAPIAYYITKGWLDDFVYRIDLSMILFIGAGFIAFLTGGLTVGFKSYQAAVANPVETLRDE